MSWDRNACPDGVYDVTHPAGADKTTTPAWFRPPQSALVDGTRRRPLPRAPDLNRRPRIRITDRDMDALALEYDAVRGQWNYTISPQPDSVIKP